MKIHAGITALAAALISTATLSAQDGGGRKQKPDRPDRPHRPPGAAFDRIDEDKSGDIDLEELKDAMSQRLEKRFKAMDKDGDGKITKDEFRPPRGPRGGKGARDGGPDEEPEEE